MERDTPLLSAASLQEGSVSKTLGDWKNMKKTFRYMNRVRFVHAEWPLYADLTIVKMSQRPEYTLQESGVLHSASRTTYEVELEVDNARCGVGSPWKEPAALLSALRKAIRVVLQGLQGTAYPVSYLEQDAVLQEYLLLVHNGQQKWPDILSEAQRKNPVLDWSRYFVGPSSRTLQWEFMGPPPRADETRVTIQQQYTVTDKADGERKLLFVGGTGRIYLMDINMNIEYTGSTVQDKELFLTILDGEHIPELNLYAAFDVYYIHGKNCRALPFVKVAGEEEQPDERYRLYLLEMICSRLLLTDTGYRVESAQCYLKVKCKQFYGEVGWKASSGPTHLVAVNNIFEGCRRLLQGGVSWDYETDGLIFTPASEGVGGVKDAADIMWKRTWGTSFKWKPPEFNTVDFMVRVVKDAAGRDSVLYDAEGSYKMLTLWCGFVPSRDLKNMYCEYALKDLLPEKGADSYKLKPTRFVPSVEPYETDAYFCKMPVTSGGQMFIDAKEPLEENTIVEFRYDLRVEDPARRWKPIRVRHDKTEQLRAYHNNFGNAYEVANANWYSIHHPVTVAMLSGEVAVPAAKDADDDVYYNRKVDDRVWSKTRALRDYHNKYVKTILIHAVASLLPPTESMTTLLDLAVGKAGDLHKWTDTRLRFVLGIDISRDNLQNAVDGACKRYVEWRQKNRGRPFRAIFLQGDCGKHIIGGDALVEHVDKHIMKCLLGKTKDTEYKVVGNHFGVAKHGFHITSCQFAIHYFFENRRRLNEFLRNVCELTADGGYFIGTCYDGRTVFERLKGAALPIMATYPHPETGEPVDMFKLERRFTQNAMENDATSLGYKIDVYQETINKVFSEYLVNFDYLVRLMAEYGFDLADDATVKEHGLAHGATGMFGPLFDSMPATGFGYAAHMSDAEKKVSFLNRYFVFRKNRIANADLVFRKQMALHQKEEEETKEKEAQVEEPQEEDIMTPVKRVPRTFEVATEEDLSSDDEEESS